MKVSLWAEIRRLHEVEGLSQAMIARRLHCHHRTVRKAMAMASPPTPTRESCESVLDRWRTQIDALLGKYPDLSAVRVREEIARGEGGYHGSIYPVRRYLHKIRPARGRVYQEVLYEPGEAVQVDWGDCGRLMVGQTPRRVSVFVAVLCYSRMCYIEFSLAERKADFYRALVHALEFFQGSPKKVIFDNLKAAVISGAGRYACLHPEFLALCGHFCLEPIACAARDPESKGIVEDGVRYVKHSALAGRSEELVTWEDYRRLAPQWRDEVATIPQLLLLDELGYLPIDKRGADLLFQVVAARYESGSVVISTNQAFRDWGAIFDVNNTLASAMIDRLMHHGEAIVKGRRRPQPLHDTPTSTPWQSPPVSLTWQPPLSIPANSASSTSCRAGPLYRISPP